MTNPKTLPADVSHLLNPRYKVIADYPNNVYDIGSVLGYNRFHQMSQKDFCDHYDKYPAIFKPLAWYEEREESEMPEYVKTEEGVVYKIKDWDNYRCPWVFVDTNVHEGYTKDCTECPLYGDFTPATQSEYETYINKTK